jgi:hypothetical protein
MATTVTVTYESIILEAAAHLGVYTGEPLSAADLQTFFFTLCALIDGWGIEPLTVIQELILPFATQAGKQSYLVGPASTNDWVTALPPMSFDGAGMLLAGAGPAELPLEIMTKARWEAVGLKTLQSNVLEGVWPNLGPAFHTLFFYPTPSAAIPINLYVPQQVSVPTSATAQLILPPGYQEGLTFELTIKASSKFRAKVPAWIPAAFEDAKEKIRGRNFQAMDIRCDAALLQRGKYTGGGSLAFYEGK